jgi:hypothetical protein
VKDELGAEGGGEAERRCAADLLDLEELLLRDGIELVEEVDSVDDEGVDDHQGLLGGDGLKASEGGAILDVGRRRRDDTPTRGRGRHVGHRSGGYKRSDDELWWR